MTGEDAQSERREARDAPEGSVHIARADGPPAPATSGLRVGAFNVNSIRARTGALGAWLDATSPDVVCLSEVRCGPASFPAAVLTDRGYCVAWADDRPGLPAGRNGVAVASRIGLEALVRPLDGPQHWSARDDRWPAGEGRLLAAEVGDGDARCTVASVYVPNGRALDHWHYQYKLAWLDALHTWAVGVDGPLVLAGDFNVAPRDADVHNPRAWRGRTHVSAAERARIARLCSSRDEGGAGLVDLWCAQQQRQGRDLDAPDPDGHTWWNYRSGALERGQGLRIDLILSSGELAGRDVAMTVERAVRAGASPSDHAPLVATFAPAR